MATSARDPGTRSALRSRVLELLRRHGWNATSFQILEQGFVYWFDGDSACVAYVDTGRAWVAAGAPIAAEAELSVVAGRFVQAARERGRGVVFFATERRFIHADGFTSLLIGEQPVYDPRSWPATLREAASLREQLRRARAKGVVVTPIDPAEVARQGAPLRRSIEALILRWMGSKALPPMGFLVRVDPFGFAHERRSFVARLSDGAGGEIVGFAAVVPVYARNGWFIEDLIRSPLAPNGTSELLVDAAMRCAAELGSGYLTLGLSPLAGAVGAPLDVAKRYGAPLYDFDGLQAFKAKFRPRDWSPIYLSFPTGQSAFGAIYASLSAFAQGGLSRYGLLTLLRGPDVVLRALGLLLVPWTLLLANIDTRRWFPSPLVQWAWVAFDVGLCVALFALGPRFHPLLSRVLVLLVAADAVLTLTQALTFNLPRAEGYADVLVVLTAIGAPALACLILANAHRRWSRVHAASAE